MLNAPISQAVGDTQHRKKKKKYIQLTFQKNLYINVQQMFLLVPVPLETPEKK